MLSVRVDRQRIRASGGSVRHALVSFIAPQASRRVPLNVGFALDRSGSMEGAKLTLVLAAVKNALRRLRSEDRFSITVFDNAVHTLAQATPADQEGTAAAIANLERVVAGGGTNLSAGWATACAEIAGHLSADGLNHCLLLTDGEANAGITDVNALTTHAGQMKARHVSTSTLGVGDDFNETLLQGMAEAGGGTFYYIADDHQIEAIIATEMDEALSLSVRDAAVVVTPPTGVAVEPLTSLPYRLFADAVRIDLGDLCAGREIAVVLEATFPPGRVGEESVLRVALEDGAHVLDTQVHTATWTWDTPEANGAQERDRDVDRAVARVSAARARREALDLNAIGSFDAASERLSLAAREIASYAGHDYGTAALLEYLRGEADQCSRPLDARTRKTVAHSSYVTLNTRERLRGAHNRAEEPARTVMAALDGVRLGPLTVHRNLAIVALLSESRETPDYLTLGEALAAGNVRVTEVSQGGSVPELSLVNDGDQPVLLLDGEQLVGAKQNRIVNVTILCPARQTLVIPVSCVEQGRWAYANHQFSDSAQMLFGRARAVKTRDVSQSLRQTGRARSDQQTVWNEIRQRAAEMGTASPTGAMGDTYRDCDKELAEFCSVLRPAPGQTGVLFLLNGRAVGLDLFDSPSTLVKSYEKLIRAFALDALSSSDTAPPSPDPDTARLFLESLRAAEATICPAVGLGDTVCLEEQNLAASALVYEERTVHLAAFAV